MDTIDESQRPAILREIPGGTTGNGTAEVILTGSGSKDKQHLN